jgi:hypothetical protein
MSRPDAVTWINAVCIDPETKQPFELLLAELQFLDHAFALDGDGRAVTPELVYAAGKKSGKSTFGAILVLVATLLYGGRNAEAYVLANDLEQSSTRVFSTIKKIVRASPALRDKARITNTQITFPSTGATITAIASDYAGAAGGNPVISAFDELWGYVSESSRRLWDEMIYPPTKLASWRLTTTYAGFSGESVLLEELYKSGIAQPQIGPDLYSGEGQLTFWTHSPVAPWQTPSWYAQMRRSLRPNQFARMIENRWVTSQSSFIDMVAWGACVDPGLKPLSADKNLPIYVAVDASLKRDSTAIVAVSTDGERVRLVTHRVFQPSPDAPLDFEATIEATIVDLCSSYSVQEILYDPWQMASVAQRLVRRGVPMREFPQTSGNLTDASSNLFELITNGNLSAYPDDAMRLSVSQAIAVETPRGWRIAKEKAKHKIDVVVALGMAALAAVKQKPVAGWGVLEFYRRQAEAVNKAPPTVLQEQATDAAQIVQKPARPADFVRINVPGDLSYLYGISGTGYVVEIENAQRVAWMAPDDAREQISSPLSVAFFESNADLRAQLGNKPPQPRGIRLSDMLQAVEDSRPVNFNNKGAITRESLAMLRRAR